MEEMALQKAKFRTTITSKYEEHFFTHIGRLYLSFLRGEGEQILQQNICTPN